MCLSRQQKAELFTSRCCFQTPASFTLLMAQKPDQTLVSQYVKNLPTNRTWLQNTVATKPYVKMGCMSTQLKAEFVGDIFHIRSFWGGYGKILPKTWFIQEGAMCLEMLIQWPVKFPTTVTRKSLIVWSRLMDQQKTKRVVLRNGIRDFWSFGQSETRNWRSVLPLFCSDAEFSSDVDHQNSITFKPRRRFPHEKKC
jgi:hypothetical protein